MGFLSGLLLTVQALACIFLILIVLMQPSKSDGGGLGSAFGGGATDTLFGARTGNVLTKATVWCAGIIFVCCVALSMIYSRQTSVVLQHASPVTQKAAEPKPAAPAATEKSAAPAKPAATEKPTAEKPASTPTPEPAKK